MGDVNYFGMRDHSIFICYNDMIKLTYPILLHDIIKDYYDDLKDYLELDKIKHYDIFNLERICAERIDINPLKYIKKPNCTDETCDLLLKTFSEEMTHMYTQSRFSSFGAKLYTVLPQDRVKDVYIYVENPCYQVIYDCDLHFGKYKDKIKYLTGDFIEAVQKVPNRPTCYALNNVDYVHELIKHQYIPYTEIILGELGCNYELDDKLGMKLKGGIDEKMMKEKVFKLGVTPLIELDKKHFSQIDMDEFK
jgi:hypothetical protein